MTTPSSNLLLGGLAGFAAAVVAAVAWGAISAATSYQIGFMAIGVGLLVAYAVRIAGGGHDRRFGYVSAAMSLLGCVLGNFFATCAFFAAHDRIDVLTALAALVPHFATVMRESFRPMDLLFYAIGAYFGYKYAIVPLRARVAPPSA